MESEYPHSWTEAEIEEISQKISHSCEDCAECEYCKDDGNSAFFGVKEGEKKNGMKFGYYRNIKKNTYKCFSCDSRYGSIARRSEAENFFKTLNWSIDDHIIAHICGHGYEHDEPKSYLKHPFYFLETIGHKTRLQFVYNSETKELTEIPLNK